MPAATLTTKGQITIPKEVREHLGVDTGDRLSFAVQEDGTVIVKPIETTHPVELVGTISKHRIQGQVHGGGPRLAVSTGSG